jgi:tetratricopeptide (TPR) repeat protein
VLGYRVAFVASVLVPLTLLGAPGLVSLTTLAAASPRPAVCRPASGPNAGELWSRARRERAQRFCVLLSRGYARLERAPVEALELAQKAGAILPHEVEARVLAGRAALRLGEAERARAALSGSVTAPGRPLGDVSALRELGVALTQTGQLAEAAAIYRVLVPRVDFVKDGVFVRTAVLEAAAALMATGAPGVAEAALYLAEARRTEPIPGLQDLTVALFAVALDRDGKSDQAGVALEELSSAWALERFLSERERARVAGSISLESASATGFRDRAPMLVDGELHAAIALASTRKDAKLAAIHWAAFLESRAGSGPFAGWARKHLTAVEGSAGGTR